MPPRGVCPIHLGPTQAMRRGAVEHGDGDNDGDNDNDHDDRAGARRCPGEPRSAGSDRRKSGDLRTVYYLSVTEESGWKLERIDIIGVPMDIEPSFPPCQPNNKSARRW